MSLSTLNLQFLLETYKKYLQSHPLLTKSITSGVLGFAGSAVAAKLRNSNESVIESTRPLTIYGLCITGPITHYFYNALEIMLKGNVKGKVLFERLIFAPLFMVLTLYILERLKGSNHEKAFEQLKKNYVSALLGNWKIWTIPQLINLSIIPVQYRVLFANAVAFFWNIYLANKTSNKTSIKEAQD